MRDIAIGVVLLLLAATPAPAAIDNAGGLAAAIRRARDRSHALQARSWDAEAEQSLVAEIDRLTDAFHDLAARGTPMQQTSRALVALIDEVRERYTDVLERMQAEVIRVDGDLEAVQDSAAWREREVLAMRLLYRLNWVRYERAMRYETVVGARKRLLEQAQDGFTEFLGSGDRELTIETLFGHGLASKALKQYDTALEDFRAALAQGPGADMATRIRVPMAEVFLATGRVAAALDMTARLLSATGGDRALRSQSLFLRAKALLIALERRTGSEATLRRYRAEAARVLEDLYERGSYWKAKVVQLVDAGMGEPADWASVPASDFVTWLLADSLRRQGDYDDAVRLYERLLDGDRFRSEALYGLGFSHFHEGAYARALERLGAYLEQAAPDEPSFDEAAYLRFKAAESLYLRTAPEEREAAAERYVTAMRDFLAKAPEHAYAFEAWFRLGEWHREQDEFRACAEAFAEVEGDPAFELKAAFLSAQCYVEAVLARDEAEPAPAALVQTAVTALDRFLELAEGGRGEGQTDAGILEPLEAKATVMAAAMAGRGGVGSMQERLRRLDGFEQRFAAERELLPEVLSLRIVAHRSLGDLDSAGAALETLLALEVPGAYRADSLRKLGIVFLKEAAARDEAGQADAARRSRRVALRVYEKLLEDTRTDVETRDDQAVAGLERLVEDLRSEVEAAGAAPAPPR